MKVIKQFEHLTVSGENIYDSADTALYWNSIGENNIAQIVNGSFVGDRQVDIVVPCCLPDYNKVVICNYVGCHTGSQSYRYVAAPQIDNFLPNFEHWGDNVIVKGKYFEDVTGVYVGDIQATNYHLPSRNKMIFEMPNSVQDGFITIYTKVGSATSSQKITGIRPEISASMQNSPKYYGESGLMKGESLDLVNRVELQAFNGLPIYAEGGLNLQNLSTTGLRFAIVEGAASDSSIKAQEVNGQFVNGIFQTSVEEEFTLGSSLDLKSVYINNFDNDRQVYNQQIRVSGVNLHKSKVLFKGYDDVYVEGSYVSSGKKYKAVNIPKNIKTSQVLASGVGGDYTGTHASVDNFYPLPTITSVDKASWTMGEQINIEAINASEALETVGITGTNLIDNQRGTFFVASDSAAIGGINNFGYVVVDNSELSTDPTNGVTKISALVNSTMAGQGKIFLLSSVEHPDRIDYNNISQALKDSYSFKNINDIAYSQDIDVSGKATSVLGVSHPQSASAGQVSVSGRYFLPMTGVQLKGASTLEVKTIPTSSLIDINGHPIRMVPSGNANNYECVHLISMNIEDFNFESKEGVFEILTP